LGMGGGVNFLKPPGKNGGKITKASVRRWNTKEEEVIRKKEGVGRKFY